MKQTLIFFLLSLTTLVMAYPADEDGNVIIPEPLEETCRVKGLVTGMVYLDRDVYSEEEALEGLVDAWESEWRANPHIKHETFVDMQRIIRDAYRKDVNGNFVRACCTDEAMQQRVDLEAKVCLLYQGY